MIELDERKPIYTKDRYGTWHIARPESRAEGYCGKRLYRIERRTNEEPNALCKTCRRIAKGLEPCQHKFAHPGRYAIGKNNTWHILIGDSIATRCGQMLHGVRVYDLPFDLLLCWECWRRRNDPL